MSEELSIIRVFLVDETYTSLKVQVAETNMEDIWAGVCRRLEIPLHEARCFFLWIASDEEDKLLPSRMPLSDLLELGEIGIDTVDVVKNILSKRRENSSVAPSPMVRTKSSFFSTREGVYDYGEFKTLKFHLFLKPTQIVLPSEEKRVKSFNGIRLFYIQAVYNIIQSFYPFSAGTCVLLAGIQAQIIFGDHDPDRHGPGFLLEVLEQFLPRYVMKTKRDEDWEKLITANWKGHSGKKKLQLMNEYLHLVRQSPVYGCVFYPGVYIEGGNSAYRQQREGKVVVGINFLGIHIVWIKEHRFISYPFSKLWFWDSTASIFFFEYENDNKKKMSESVYTRHAPAINDAMHDWHYMIERLIKKKNAQAKKNAED